MRVFRLILAIPFLLCNRRFWNALWVRCMVPRVDPTTSNRLSIDKEKLSLDAIRVRSGVLKIKDALNGIEHGITIGPIQASLIDASQMKVSEIETAVLKPCVMSNEGTYILGNVLCNNYIPPYSRLSHSMASSCPCSAWSQVE